MFKLVLLLGTAPSAIAAQTVPTVAAVYNSYKIAPGWLQKMLSPFTPVALASPQGPGSAAETQMYLRAMANQQAVIDHGFRCADDAGHPRQRAQNWETPARGAVGGRRTSRVDSGLLDGHRQLRLRFQLPTTDHEHHLSCPLEQIGNCWFHSLLHNPQSVSERLKTSANVVCIAEPAFLLLLLLLLGRTGMFAQQSLWKQLDAKASNLEDKGQYNEALPIAIQALNAAQKAFGLLMIPVSQRLSATWQRSTRPFMRLTKQNNCTSKRSPSTIRNSLLTAQISQATSTTSPASTSNRDDTPKPSRFCFVVLLSTRWLLGRRAPTWELTSQSSYPLCPPGRRFPKPSRSTSALLED